MQVLLDEQPYETDAATIGEAIAAAAETAEQDGRVIVEVIVDGAPWRDEQLGSPALCGQKAEEIRLVSSNLTELVGQTLGEASGALAEADELQQAAAELIQADQQPAAMAKLGEALTIWLTVHEAVVKSTAALNLDLDAVTIVDGGTVADAIGRLNERLWAMRSAMEARDFVAVSDTLLYELPTVVAEWRGVLDCIRAHVETGQAK